MKRLPGGGVGVRSGQGVSLVAGQEGWRGKRVVRAVTPAHFSSCASRFCVHLVSAYRNLQ
jgi:hypothetical protein